jgi:long-chain fatty acid transport protein
MGRLAGSLLAAISTLACVVLHAERASAQCGGICPYEVGTFDMATSAAGASARAQGPGTALFNPAGMTRLENTQVHIGMTNSISSIKFNPSSRTEPNPPDALPWAGFNGGDNLGSYLPFAGAFATHQFSDRISAGMSFTGLWGGSADYGTSWAGRSYVIDASLVGFAIQPAIAFRVTDWLSIGGSIGAAYAAFDYEFLASLEPGAAALKINDADDWGVVGSLSLLFEPTETTRIGINWRSEVALTLKGTFNTPSNIPASDLDFSGEMNFPQGVNVGVFHQLTEKWALLADGGWSDWSQFGLMPATLNSAVILPIDRNWRDTWRLGVGAHYQVQERLMLAAGFSYDSSPVTASKRLPDIPVGENYRFSGGLSFDAASNIELGLTYTFLWFGNMEIDQLALPPSQTLILDGKYDPGHVHFVGIHVSFSFGGDSSN